MALYEEETERYEAGEIVNFQNENLAVFLWKMNFQKQNGM